MTPFAAPSRLLWVALGLSLLMATAALPAAAGVMGTVGPYSVTLATDPQTIPIGRANVYLKLIGADGAPVEGAHIVTLVKMPTMDMGEREQHAMPEPEPGVYMAPAVFAMAGPYHAILTISGPLGEASGHIELQTGMDTGPLEGGEAAAPWRRAVPWVAGLLALAFVARRMRATGQRVNWRAALHWQFLAGVGVLAAMTAFAMYAVNNWRRPGAMTPIEAQAMEMNTPAPPSDAPVTLTPASRGEVLETVRYTGQAAGYAEGDVVPRVRGWITWMPLYVGDTVKMGQVVARLDTSEIDPRIAESRATERAAERGSAAASAEHRQALEEANRIRAEARGSEAGLRDARASVEEARADHAGAQAGIAAAEDAVAVAEADLEAARAGDAYWREQVKRTGALKEAGAVSGEEMAREQAQAREAAASVARSEAAVRQARAEAQARRSAVRRAEAAIRGATARVERMAAEMEANRSEVRSAEAAVTAARARIGASAAGESQARAAASAVETERTYTEIRAPMDGVVTHRLISPGVLVEPGQAILRIARTSPIRLQANVASPDLKRLTVGASVALRPRAGTGPAVYAAITSIAPGVDPETRTGVVEAVYPNPGGAFRPGEYVVMDITVGKAVGALRVPAAAVRVRPRVSGAALSPDTIEYVWVADPIAGDDGRFTVRSVPVTVGLRGAGHVEIASGLRAGDRVVTSGQQGLEEGDTVTAAAGGAP